MIKSGAGHSHILVIMFLMFMVIKKDIREYKLSVSSVDIKSYRTGNFYIGQEYGIPHADIPFSIEIFATQFTHVFTIVLYSSRHTHFSYSGLCSVC